MLAGLAFTLTSRLSIAAEAYGLYVAPRAVEVDGKVLGIKHSISYYVPETLPASNTLEFIARRLARQAGVQLPGRVAGQWSSHHSGWLEFAKPIRILSRYLWSATWVNVEGTRCTTRLGLHSARACTYADRARLSNAMKDNPSGECTWSPRAFTTSLTTGDGEDPYWLATQASLSVRDHCRQLGPGSWTPACLASRRAMNSSVLLAG